MSQLVKRNQREKYRSCIIIGNFTTSIMGETLVKY